MTALQTAARAGTLGLDGIAPVDLMVGVILDLAASMTAAQQKGLL